MLSKRVCFSNINIKFLSQQCFGFLSSFFFDFYNREQNNNINYKLLPFSKYDLLILSDSEYQTNLSINLKVGCTWISVVGKPSI